MQELPQDIKKLMSTFLETSSLGFFAATCKENLISSLPEIIRRQKIALQQLLKPPRINIKTRDGVFFCYSPKAIFVCGDNEFSQLGLGHKKYQNRFTQVAELRPPGIIQEIALGLTFSVVRTDEGIFIFGNEIFGWLDLAKRYYKLNNNSPMLQLDIDPLLVQEIIVGGSHILLRTDSGLLACGTNAFGQLGIGNSPSKYNFVSTTGLQHGKIYQVLAEDLHNIVWSEHGLFACGCNVYGQLGLGDSDNRDIFTLITKPPPGIIQQIAVGKYHTVVKTDQGIFVCGLNNGGQLGLGHNENCTGFTRVTSLPEGDIFKIWAGAFQTFLLAEQGLFACGNNDQGQLGFGNEKNCNRFTRINQQPPGIIQQLSTSSKSTLVLTNQGLFITGADLETFNSLTFKRIEIQFPDLQILLERYSELEKSIERNERLLAKLIHNQNNNNSDSFAPDPRRS